VRGCLTLVIGFVVGLGLMLWWWPKPPHGASLPSSSDVRATVSDAYLTRMVAAKAATIQFPSISQVQVLSNPPTTLVVHGQASAGVVTAPLSMEFEPRVQNGQVQVQVVSASLGGISIPPQLTFLIADRINSAIAPLAGSNTSVTGVGVSPQGVTITANAR
jgi:uncharacterized protein YpmS